VNQALTELLRRSDRAASGQRIPVADIARDLMKDPEVRAEYEALEDEFALATALIEARTSAKMTQEQVAQAMGTTQAVIARLESGRSKPSTRTLERFAKATGTHLRISFERRPNQSRVGKTSSPPQQARQQSTSRRSTTAGS
jgi:ribosome-binding protein aMBF1 (putative translation factor)